MGMLLRRYHKGDGRMPSPVETGAEENKNADADVEKKKPGRKPKAATEEKE